ncbi:hypothetical protein ARMGADRAFT_1020914 [Armillaria gallica]|uniref:Uncharacterized protein n=1 Tax=Armillaria gallica TaxID=47427 RepID=A0A2H3CBJ5_ARMGA|nr:hypothetical protein ARMGADRAFT_1020914 [Armillaria gallica]
MRFREAEVTEVRAGMFDGRRPKRSIRTLEYVMFVPSLTHRKRFQSRRKQDSH